MADEYKQVILVRNDLKMSKGKTAAQVAHAAVEAALRAPKQELFLWRESGMKKITLKVSSEKELFMFLQRAKDMGLTTALITDAGHTELEPNTRTCLAIGPDKEKSIDSITKTLSPL